MDKSVWRIKSGNGLCQELHAFVILTDGTRPPSLVPHPGRLLSATHEHLFLYGFPSGVCCQKGVTFPDSQVKTASRCSWSVFSLIMSEAGHLSCLCRLRLFVLVFCSFFLCIVGRLLIKREMTVSSKRGKDFFPLIYGLSVNYVSVASWTSYNQIYP